MLVRRAGSRLCYPPSRISVAGSGPGEKRSAVCEGECVPVRLGGDCRRDTETAPWDAPARLARSGRRVAPPNGNPLQRVRARRRGLDASRLRVAPRRVAGPVLPPTTGNPGTGSAAGTSAVLSGSTTRVMRFHPDCCSDGAPGVTLFVCLRQHVFCTGYLCQWHRGQAGGRPDSIREGNAIPRSSSARRRALPTACQLGCPPVGSHSRSLPP